MADDRPAESEVDQIARMQRDLDDLRSTLLARVSRRPTGDVEYAIRSTPKPDTLLMQGQTVLRSDYPVLWQWAQDQGLIGVWFTTGDGTTTFGLPDMRGLVLVGAGTRGADTYALGQIIGASTKTLTTANLPAHDHNVTVTLSQHEGHAHGVGGAGGHGGHNAGDFAASNGAGSVFHVANNGNAGGGDHGHGTSIEGQGKPHSVTVNETMIGSGTPLDVRQAGIAVNWLIYV